MKEGARPARFLPVLLLPAWLGPATLLPLTGGCALTNPFRHHPPAVDQTHPAPPLAPSQAGRSPVPGDSLFVGPVLPPEGASSKPESGEGPARGTREGTKDEARRESGRGEKKGPDEAGTAPVASGAVQAGAPGSGTEGPESGPAGRTAGSASSGSASSDTSKEAISVDLPPAERDRLFKAALQDWNNANRALAAVDTLGLPESTLAQVRTARALLAAADEARRRADVLEYAGLAHKAFILSEGISSDR